MVVHLVFTPARSFRVRFPNLKSRNFVRTAVATLALLPIFVLDARGWQAEAQTPKPWTVLEADGSCEMYRNENAAFAFFWVTPDGKYYLRVHNGAWNIAAGQRALKLSVNDKNISVIGTGTKTSDGMNGIVAKVDRATFDEIGRATSLTFIETDDTRYRADFPPADQTIKDVLACHDKVAASMASGTRFIASRASPASSPAGWITSADYPATARQFRRSGMVAFRLSVDVTGVPTTCKIILSSQVPDLDAAVCPLLMQRARFTPARAHDGTAMADIYTNSIRWSAP